MLIIHKMEGVYDLRNMGGSGVIKSHRFHESTARYRVNKMIREPDFPQEIT
jgi:hypothetical protein